MHTPRRAPLPFSAVYAVSPAAIEPARTTQRPSLTISAPASKVSAFLPSNELCIGVISHLVLHAACLDISQRILGPTISSSTNTHRLNSASDSGSGPHNCECNSRGEPSATYANNHNTGFEWRVLICDPYSTVFSVGWLAPSSSDMALVHCERRLMTVSGEQTR
ncbi:hypothetical protein MKEN_00950500 [Mycena kentingensis (nom. inval.)]|nr:hypothetical protein MKEN_00950500 [Mycena kentingensis (nom. inval.)]